MPQQAARTQPSPASLHLRPVAAQGQSSTALTGAHAALHRTSVTTTVALTRLCAGHEQGLDRLTRLIFARAEPKRLGTQIISGSMLAALAEAYVSAINHGAVPTIATAWQVGPLLLAMWTPRVC